MFRRYEYTVTWLQQIMLWAAWPLALSLIATTVIAFRATMKAQEEENDSTC